MRNKDEEFLVWASFGASLFSNCAKRQFLAVVLDHRGRVVGTGYNGSPPGMGHCLDGYCPRAQASSPAAGHEDCIAVHAEANALLYSDASVREGGTLIVNGIPCYACAKLIAGSGLARVVYLRVGTADEKKSYQLLEDAGLRVVGYTTDDVANWVGG